MYVRISAIHFVAVLWTSNVVSEEAEEVWRFVHASLIDTQPGSNDIALHKSCKEQTLHATTIAAWSHLNKVNVGISVGGGYSALEQASFLYRLI